MDPNEPRMKTDKTFLLADDDLDDIILFCEALREVDPSIHCHTVNDGAAALELLDELPNLPDLIFLDINMPRMNGWECLAKLKESEKYGTIPVLMYSTSTLEKDANMALDLGALCFFSKPHQFNELRKVLEVIASNLGDNLIDAISQFNYIRSKKVFSCQE